MTTRGGRMWAVKNEWKRKKKATERERERKKIKTKSVLRRLRAVGQRDIATDYKYNSRYIAKSDPTRDRRVRLFFIVNILLYTYILNYYYSPKIETNALYCGFLNS